MSDDNTWWDLATLAGSVTPGVSEAMDVAEIGGGINDVYEGRWYDGVNRGLAGAVGLAIPFVNVKGAKAAGRLAGDYADDAYEYIDDAATAAYDYVPNPWDLMGMTEKQYDKWMYGASDVKEFGAMGRGYNMGGLTDLDDPTNRDTVPAMLTPGEFVINKEATQKYGPLLEKINNEGLQMRHEGNIPHYNNGGLVSFLKKHEGWRDKAYQDSGGVWTIGYGRTRNADGTPIKPNQTTTKEAEDSWIESRANKEWSAINDYAEKHNYDWTDKEKEALASFRYNGGQGMIDQLTAGGTRDMDTIKSKFGLYNKAGGQTVDGLINRRNYEMEHAGWGTVGEAPEGSSATSFQLVGQGTPEHVEEVRQPVPPVAGSVPVVPQPDQPVEREMDVSPRAEAGDAVGMPGMPGIQDLIGMAMGGGGAPAGPMLQHGGMRPIQTAEEIRQMTQGYNFGGWVQSLFGGGQPAVDPMAGYANYSQQDFLNEAQNFNNPGAQLQGYETVPGMSAPPSEISPIPQAYGDVRPNTGLATANHAGNRFMMGFPEGAGVPANLETLPPVPGSDEALLQGSSDQVEKAESEVAQMRKQYLGMESTGNAGIEYDPRGNNQVPTPDWQMTPEGMSVAQPVNPENIDRTPSVLEAVTGLPLGNTRGADAYLGDVPLANVAPNIGDEYAVPRKPQVPGDTSAPTDSGWASLTPEQFLQEAQPKENPQSVEQEAASILQNPEATPEEITKAQEMMATGERPQGEMSPMLDKKGASPVEKRAAAEAKVKEIGEEPLSKDEAQVAETAGKNMPPAQLEHAKNVLQENFGDLFDKKELMRAALLFGGAMITGMSPGRALAFAGSQYMNRLDAKEALKQKTAADAQKAAAENAPYRTGNRETFYGPNGNKIEAVEVKRGKDTMFINPKTNEEIPMDYTQDAAQVKGTPEWNKAVQTSAKNLQPLIEENMITEMKNEFGDRAYKSGLKPAKVAHEVAEWAAENGIDATQMSSTIQAAMADAQRDKASGNTPKSFKAYLNDQAITARVGDPTLFQGSSPKAVNSLMDQFSSRFKGMPAYQNKSDIEISTVVMQKARPHWAAVPEDQKRLYEERAKVNPNKSAFMFWLEDEFNGRTLANKVGE